jgi:hypothetical protein
MDATDYEIEPSICMTIGLSKGAIDYYINSVGIKQASKIIDKVWELSTERNEYDRIMSEIDLHYNPISNNFYILNDMDEIIVDNLSINNNNLDKVYNFCQHVNNNFDISSAHVFTLTNNNKFVIVKNYNDIYEPLGECKEAYLLSNKLNNYRLKSVFIKNDGYISIYGYYSFDYFYQTKIDNVLEYNTVKLYEYEDEDDNEINILFFKLKNGRYDLVDVESEIVRHSLKPYDESDPFKIYDGYFLFYDENNILHMYDPEFGLNIEDIDDEE